MKDNLQIERRVSIEKQELNIQKNLRRVISLKKFIYAATFSLALSISSLVAFADNSTTNSTTISIPQETAITAPNLNENDPSYLSLTSNYNKLLELRKQENKLREDIKIQTVSNSETAKSVWQSVYNKLKEDREYRKEQVTTSKGALETLITQRKTLSDLLDEAKKSKNITQVEALKLQLANIDAQIKVKRESIKLINDTTKATINADKTVVAKARYAHTQINTLQEQMKNMHVDIHTLRVEKAKEWTAFGNSIMKDNDLSVANAQMINIVNYKQQIIDKLNSILLLKKQVNSLLNSVLKN